MKIKVCGMKYSENIEALAKLNPDFMGFIFYEKSPRFAATDLDKVLLSNLDSSITKVGVFVNKDLLTIKLTCSEYEIKTVQLHGDESPELCAALKDSGFTVIKVFGINEFFDFKKLYPYANHCDYFLFDTITHGYGGSGTKFDWELLENYRLGKPYFLSGGIGLEHLSEIKNNSDDRLHGIDVNSRFEIKPGLKNISALESLFKEIKDGI